MKKYYFHFAILGIVVIVLATIYAVYALVSLDTLWPIYWLSFVAAIATGVATISKGNLKTVELLLLSVKIFVAMQIISLILHYYYDVSYGEIIDQLFLGHIMSSLAITLGCWLFGWLGKMSLQKEIEIANKTPAGLDDPQGLDDPEDLEDLEDPEMTLRRNGDKC